MSEHGKSHQIEYFVNGEVQHASENELSAGDILENAGFSPAADYVLEEDANRKIYADPAAIVRIHEKEKFTATYKGPTPTSH